MAASANPSESHNNQDPSYFNGSGGGGGASTSNNNGNLGSGSSSGRDNSVNTASAMKHNPGIATEWSSDEQAILDDGLTKYASGSNLVRYAKIAMQLPNKTVRDVALRVRWMNKKELSKRRKDDHSRKNKEKREKVTESSSKSQLPSRPGGHPYSAPTVSLDNDDGVSYKAIGGPTGELLEQNSQFLQQISTNISSYQIHDNIPLFCQARDNLIKMMNSIDDIPEIMKQMPPLPVKLNEELANTILR